MRTLGSWSLLAVLVFAMAGFGTAGEMVFKLGHCHPTSSQFHAGSLKFAELVAAKTKGEVKIGVYPNNQIGDEPELVQGMKMGTVDMGLVASGNVAKYNPDFYLFDLPYLFRSYEHVDTCLNGDIGKALAARTAENGIQIMSYWESGFRHFLNNKRPIKSPGDMKGLKMRTPDWPALIAATTQLGGSPVPMPFGELYMACQQGVVDGQEGPVFAIKSAKMYEVQKYMVLDGHTYTAMVLGVNPKKFARLSPENQRLVLEAAVEAGAYQRKLIRDQVENELKFLETEGKMEIYRTPDKQEWIDATKPVYETLKDRFNQDLIKKIQSM